MNGEPFSSRLAVLIQRARKAIRMYSSIERSSGGDDLADEAKELQAREWRSVNECLIGRVSAVIGNRPMTAVSSRELISIFRQFESEAQESKEILSMRHERLVDHAHTGEYIVALKVSRELIITKARLHAVEAVLNEMTAVLGPQISRQDSMIGGRSGEVTNEIGTNGKIKSDNATYSPSEENDRQDLDSLKGSQKHQDIPTSDELRFVANRLKSTVSRPTSTGEASRVIPLRRALIKQ